MALELKQISAQKLKTLNPEKTLFLYSVGVLEDHGPHLPLGMDLIESEAVSRTLAAKIEKELPEWTVVQMPPAPLGIDSSTSDLRLTVRPYVLRDYLVDTALSLVRQGFKKFAVTSGNLGPSHLTAIEEAGKMIRRRSALRFGFRGALLLSLQSALADGKTVSRSPFFLDEKEHGGERDTSVALHVCSDSVDPLYSGLPEQLPESFVLNRRFRYLMKKTRGYWGKPSQATAEKGEKEIQNQVNRIFERLKRVLEGAPPRSLFRTWYSVLPPNQSFFKGWLLFVLIFAMMSIWAWYLIRGFSF